MMTNNRSSVRCRGETERPNPSESSLTVQTFHFHSERVNDAEWKQPTLLDRFTT